MHAPSLPALAVTGLALALLASVPGGEGSSIGGVDPARGAPLQVSGRALARDLGCGGCHAGTTDATVVRSRTPALGPKTPALGADSIFSYLADPVRGTEEIGATRMPDFRLDEAERLALALFLGGAPRPDGRAAAARARHPQATSDLGGKIWGVLGCAGCHGADDTNPANGASGVGPDLSREGVRVREDWLRGYLADPRPIRSPAHPANPGSRMPSFRLSSAEVRALSAYVAGLGSPSQGEPGALSASERRRLGRFLDKRLACLGCHRLGGRGGGIGPSLDGVAARLRPGFVVEMIRNPATAVAGAPMPRQRMPEREARRLARFVLDAGREPWRPASQPSLADPEHPAWGILEGSSAIPVSDSAPPDGSALYRRHCAACHGPEGRADGWNAHALPMPPAVHADGAAMSRRSDDALYDGIHAGAFVLDGSPRMPPFGDLLSPSEIRAVVAYIRVLCDCRGPSWSRGEGDG